MVAFLDFEKQGTVAVPVEEIFRRRWSPHAFADTAVDTRQLQSIFSAGQWAASSSNEQPWRFAVGRKGDAVWQRIFEALTPGNQSWTKDAPVRYASFAKKTFSKNGAPNRVAQHDVGAASAQMALQLRLRRPTISMRWRAGPWDIAAIPTNCRSNSGRGNSHKPLSEWVFSDWGTAAF